MDYLTHSQETIFRYVQEFFAVAFQLICLSRLGTDEITSNLVLFLTLIVFSGPFLNTWLMIVDHLFIKKDLSTFNFRAIMIWIFHGFGAALASLIVDKGHKGWSQYIIWNARPTNQTKIYTNIGTVDTPNSIITDSTFDWGTTIFEEMSAVLSLLIGCIYLLWLSEKEKKMRRKMTHKVQTITAAGTVTKKDLPPLMDIQFYLRLTLFVASVSRGFPSAHLSFHISVYLRCMDLITDNAFWAHVIGGVIGLILTIIFVRAREYIGWTYNDEDENEEIDTSQSSKVSTGGGTLFKQNQYIPLRVSLHGGNYL